MTAAETTAPAALPPGRRRRAAARSTMAALAALITLAWLTVLITAPRLDVGPELRRVALFGHLACVVLGFGAVLMVDWFGLLWLTGQRGLTTLVQTAHGAHLPIWLGLAGLAATGTLLSPDTSSPRTLIKLAAVLVVALNGVYAGQVQRQYARLGDRRPPRALLRRGLVAATISQAGWWTAMVIGFLSASAPA